ncbi:hypothetical protein EDB85DRAFT_355172 [Lactarius pseudohatsudake]|nr:hypothetical protein EDB85DRAFT_355172 [Lactarius pseudohatsudake]
MGTLTPPGTAYLDARAFLENPFLENPRETGHGEDTFVTVDAMILCAYPIRGIQLLCSLSYKKKHANEQIRVGIYDIYAKVVSFKPHTHDVSPTRRDTQFDLMGDILRVSLSCVLWKATHLSNVPHFISYETQTVRMWQSVGNSTRHSNVHDDSPTSHPTGCHRHHHRYTRPPLDQHLPVINSVIALTGQLVGYDANVALLALDDICYLPHPGEVN